MLPSQWRIRQTFDFITRNGNATTTYRIRVVPLEGNPWFVGADTGNALGFNLTKGIGRYLGTLGVDEMRVVSPLETPDLFGGKGTRGNRLTLISENGLYKLIMRSDKPQACAFQEWVTREVLPTIRKTGGYVLQGADRATVGEGTVAEMPDVGGRLRVLYREGRLSLRGDALAIANINDNPAFPDGTGKPAIRALRSALQPNRR